MTGWSRCPHGIIKFRTHCAFKPFCLCALGIFDEHESSLAYKLKGVINNYLDHISLPSLLEKDKWKDGGLISSTCPEELRQPSRLVKAGEWETVNQAGALLMGAKKDITPEQYDEFYQPVNCDQNAPLASTHNRVEGPTKHTQLRLFRSKAPIDMFNRKKAADPLELAKYLQGLSADGHQHGVLPGLYILSGISSSIFLPLIF